MNIKKHIAPSDWQNRLQTFTSGNRGRTSAIATEGMTNVENKPLVSVNYDPVGKGNDVVIQLEGFTHSINAPVEFYITEEANGAVSTLEIVDQNGDVTYLKLL